MKLKPKATLPLRSLNGQILVLPPAHQTASIERLSDKVDIVDLRVQSAQIKANIDRQLNALEQELVLLLSRSSNACDPIETIEQARRFIAQIRQVIEDLAPTKPGL